MSHAEQNSELKGLDILNNGQVKVITENVNSISNADCFECRHQHVGDSVTVQTPSG